MKLTPIQLIASRRDIAVVPYMEIEGEFLRKLDSDVKAANFRIAESIWHAIWKDLK